MSFRRRHSTDLGTVILHWVLAGFFAFAALSGLRIVSDEPGGQWLRALDIVLPVENLWLIHVAAGAGLAATLAAYGVYMLRSRLLPRISLGPTRLANLFVGGRMGWASAGLLTYWIFLCALALELITGINLFSGYGASNIMLHILGACVCLGFPVVHVACHWACGRGNQLMRVFRPARLIIPAAPPDFANLLAEQLHKAATKSCAGQPLAVNEGAATKRRPLLWTLTAFVAACLGLAAFQPLTSQTLVVVPVQGKAAPRLDGDLSAAAWANAPVTRVLTSHGANFGGSGESLVEVRAVHDATTIYFAFTWSDPTRSLKNLPLVKQKDGWHLVQSGHESAEEEVYYEDKFSVLIAKPGLPLIGAAIHLAIAPLGGKPAGLTGRGLHYTTNGSLAEVWQWHADRADIIDDGYFGGPVAPGIAQVEGRERYKGGYITEQGPPRYEDNFDVPATGDFLKPVLPRRLPKDLALTKRALGWLSDNPDISEQPGARWWMAMEESVPYSQAADAAIPRDTVIPGVIVLAADPGGAAVHGAALWSAGRWTLTLARKLAPPHPKDVPIETGTMMWLAAFDHSETRHTRHLRPIILELSNADPS